MVHVQYLVGLYCELRFLNEMEPIYFEALRTLPPIAISDGSIPIHLLRLQSI